MNLDEEQVLIKLEELDGFPVILSFKDKNVQIQYVNNTKVFSNDTIEKCANEYIREELERLVK